MRAPPSPPQTGWGLARRPRTVGAFPKPLWPRAAVGGDIIANFPPSPPPRAESEPHFVAKGDRIGAPFFDRLRIWKWTATPFPSPNERI